MARRIKTDPIKELFEVRLVTPEDAASLMAVGERQIWLLGKFGLIESADITINGEGGPRSLRYSLHSVQQFISKRIAISKAAIEDDGIKKKFEELYQEALKAINNQKTDENSLIRSD